jgi:hypothetical protein
LLSFIALFISPVLLSHNAPLGIAQFLGGLEAAAFSTIAAAFDFKG